MHTPSLINADTTHTIRHTHAPNITHIHSPKPEARPLPPSQAYDGFKHPIMRADFVRYLYMHHHGGLYADLDMECLKPMDSLMSTHMVVLARMGTNDSFSHSVPNAYMASVPGHPFWKFCIATSLMRWMVQLTLQDGVWYGPESITGPVVLKDAVDIYQEFHRENAPARGRLTILPAGTIYPVDWKALLDAQANVSVLATVCEVSHESEGKRS